jgi:hypothetical protein
MIRALLREIGREREEITEEKAYKLPESSD